MTVLQSVRTSEGSYSPRSVRQGEVLTADAAAILKKWDPYPPVTTQWCLYASSVAGILADPHISTFDVQRYTLLSQGTFSLWHFSGVDTDHSDEIAGTKKLPVGLASLCPLFRSPVLHKGYKGLASHRQHGRIHAASARDHFTGLQVEGTERKRRVGRGPGRQADLRPRR